MFRISKVEDVEFYISKNFKAMETYTAKRKLEINQRYSKVVSFQRKDKDVIILDRRKDIELDKMRFLRDKFIKDIDNILKYFPDFNRVDDIYAELLETYGFKNAQIKDSFGRLIFIKNKITDLAENSIVKMKRTKNIRSIGFILNKYLGRVSSVAKGEKKHFAKLDELRKIMNKFPNFLDLYTVSIVGFPNVGKSTLLNKITGSDVEIQSYPFTTKTLMFGYISQFGRRKIQLVDTPGLLGRDKNNEIEKRSEIIVKRKANLMLFVIDITETCSYTLESQIKLLKYMKSFKKDIILYFSKIDICDDYALEQKERFLKKNKYKYFEDSKELTEYLVKSCRFEE